MAFTIGSTITVTSGIEELSTMLSSGGMTTAEVEISTTAHLTTYDIKKRIIVNDGAQLNIKTAGIYQFPNISQSIRLANITGAGETAILEVGTDRGNTSIEEIFIHAPVDADTFEADEGWVDCRSESIQRYYGVTVMGRSPFGFGTNNDDPGELVVRNCRWTTESSGDFWRLNGEVHDIDTLHLKGGSIFMARNWIALDNVLITDTTNAITNNWGGGDCIATEFTFRGLRTARVTNLMQLATISSSSASPTNNCRYGSVFDFRNITDADLDTIIPRHETWNSSRSVGTVIKSFDYDIVATKFEDGTPIDAYFFGFDSDSGNRTASLVTDDTTTDDTLLPLIHHYDRDLEWYDQLSGGALSIVMQGSIFNRPRSHYETFPSVAPVWDYRLPINCILGDYDRVFKSFSISSLIGKQSQILSLEIDNNVTETRALASAYTDTDLDWVAHQINMTTGSTCQKVYNRYKHDMTLQANGRDVFNKTKEIYWDGSTFNAVAWSVSMTTGVFDCNAVGTSAFAVSAINEGLSLSNFSSVNVATLPTELILSNTIAEVGGLVDVSSWTFENGASLRLTSDATVITGGDVSLVIDPNGFVLTRDDSINVSISSPNLIAGTRVQVYNETKGVELDNSVTGSIGYTLTVDLAGVTVDDGDLIRMRTSYVNGLSCRDETENTGVIGESGLSFLINQVPCDVYDSLGIDGSLITKFTADYVNDEVDVVIGSDFMLSEFYAWWKYNLYSAQGISEFFGGITAIDEANFLIHNSAVNIKLDNITTVNVAQLDNRRLYREDGTRPVKNPTTNTGGVDVEWRSPVLIAESDSIQASLSTIETDVSAIETKAQADIRQVELIAEHNATQASIASLHNFNPAVDVVSADIISIDGDTGAPANIALETTSQLILEDTDDLQSTKGERVTAVGFSTHPAPDLSNLDVAVSTRSSHAEPSVPTVSEIRAGFNEEEFKADLSNVALEATVSTRASQASIDSLNDISVSDIETSATLAKEATVSTRASQASVDALNDVSLLEVESAVKRFA